ncbi:MAG TPA: hypothetical protein DEB32_06370, partial [Stenotrophomonas sp.]|nr:hypothetical protein [Stenotrophomonas sp.]
MRRSGRRRRALQWRCQRAQGLVDHRVYPMAGRVEEGSFRVAVAALMHATHVGSQVAATSTVGAGWVT